MNIRALAKVLILTTGIFPAWSLNNLLGFFKTIIFYFRSALISDILTLFEYIIRIKIKNKCEKEDHLDLFLNGPNFIWNGVSISMMLIKAIFLQVTHRKGYLSAHEVLIWGRYWKYWVWRQELFFHCSCGIIIS